jgi:8-oxo-dGTP pyrophosphatase MutT (NUDIX family)
METFVTQFQPHRAAEVYRGVVSVKGIVLHSDCVVLLRNDRDHWELPGGTLELGETPEECLAREIVEELGLIVRVGPLVDVWLFEHIIPDAHVFIVTYGCYALSFDPASLVLSSEHSAIGCFPITEIESLPLPAGYQRSIHAWVNDPRSSERAE